MSAINDGGPAFPHPDYLAAGWHGMTLRDYFAAMVVGHLSVSPLRQEMSFEEDASYAYRVADALLKAREVRP